MSPRKVRTADDVRRMVHTRGPGYVKVGVFDVDGVLRGKYMSRDKFLSALESGFGFCDVVLGWDSYDQLYDNVAVTGWHTGYPDAEVRLLPETFRTIPFEDDMPFVLGAFAGKWAEVCPRGVLARVLARAEALGFKVKAAAEFEFFVFEETPQSVRAKGYRDLRSITPAFFGYSVLRTSVHAEFHRALLDLCRAMDFPLEGLHTETGPGVLEAAIAADEAMRAADKAALFKTFAKILAQRHGWMATFMAKWSAEWPGQSGHLHISLTDKRGRSAFHAPKAPHGISRTMRHFIGGQQRLMPELLAMAAPTVNAYARLIPGFWAPTAANWGVGNRTCAIRAIPGSAKNQRIEYRVTAADINPYVALAAAIGSGLWGIEHEIEPDAPVEGDAYAKTFPARRQLPRTLWDAAQRLKGSKTARALFGEAFVEHYAATREWEEREFRRAITDWEMERYFEII